MRCRAERMSSERQCQVPNHRGCNRDPSRKFLTFFARALFRHESSSTIQCAVSTFKLFQVPIFTPQSPGSGAQVRNPDLTVYERVRDLTSVTSVGILDLYVINQLQIIPVYPTPRIKGPVCRNSPYFLPEISLRA